LRSSRFSPAPITTAEGEDTTEEDTAQEKPRKRLYSPLSPEKVLRALKEFRLWPPVEIVNALFADAEAVKEAMKMGKGTVGHLRLPKWMTGYIATLLDEECPGTYRTLERLLIYSDMGQNQIRPVKADLRDELGFEDARTLRRRLRILERGGKKTPALFRPLRGNDSSRLYYAQIPEGFARLRILEREYQARKKKAVEKIRRNKVKSGKAGAKERWQ